MHAASEVQRVSGFDVRVSDLQHARLEHAVEHERDRPRSHLRPAEGQLVVLVCVSPPRPPRPQQPNRTEKKTLTRDKEDNQLLFRRVLKISLSCAKSMQKTYDYGREGVVSIGV